MSRANRISIMSDPDFDGDFPDEVEMWELGEIEDYDSLSDEAKEAIEEREKYLRENPIPEEDEEPEEDED